VNLQSVPAKRRPERDANHWPLPRGESEWITLHTHDLPWHDSSQRLVIVLPPSCHMQPVSLALRTLNWSEPEDEARDRLTSCFITTSSACLVPAFESLAQHDTSLQTLRLFNKIHKGRVVPVLKPTCEGEYREWRQSSLHTENSEIKKKRGYLRLLILGLLFLQEF